MTSSNYRPLNVDGNDLDNTRTENQYSREDDPLISLSTPQGRRPSQREEFSHSSARHHHDSDRRSEHLAFLSKPQHATSNYVDFSGLDSYPLDSDISQQRDVAGRQSKIPRKPIPTASVRPVSTTVNSKTSERAYTANIELLPLQPDDTAQLDQASGNLLKEWRPTMLRRIPAAVLILTCVAFAILLECLRIMADKQQGFSTDNNKLVQLAKYLPTVAVICLGFAWKSLVWDLKIITPFSILSQKQGAKSEQSMELDYIDTLEFNAVWKSAKNRHWAVFLGLVVGLLSGMLVPLASSLTFVELFSEVHEDAMLQKNTQFSYKDTLATDNGTLYIPWDYKGSQPYAAVFSSQQVNGKTPPWTTKGYALESFEITEWKNEFAVVSAIVGAFYASFDCQTLRYDYIIGNDSFGRLFANDDDLETANCQPRTPQLRGLFASNSLRTEDLGWLNVTDCSDNGSDIRMLATIMVGTSDYDLPISAATGLICRPQYFNRDIELRVNGSTGDILSANETPDQPVSVDIGASLPVVVTYLNNPSDMASQLAYVVNTAGPHPTFKLPLATFTNATIYANTYQKKDVFFKQLYAGDRKASHYISDPMLLKKEVGEYTNSLLTQIMSSFARTNVSVQLPGSVLRIEPRLQILNPSLRAIQGILAVMAVICGLCCTILRPKTTMTENPSSIAAVSVVLSNSESMIEQEVLGAVMRKGSSSVTSSLSSWRWYLDGFRQSGPRVMAEKDQSHASDIQENNPNYQSSLTNANHEQGDWKGYQPFALRQISRVLLIFFISTTIISLAVLLNFSSKKDGFVAETSVVSTAWSIIPTTLLVLLGYAMASVHAVLQSLTPYLALRKTSRSGSIFSKATSSILVLPFQAFARFGSITLLITSLILFLFPAVKILAAGLYEPSASTKTTPVRLSLNTGLTDLFEDMYEAFPSSSAYSSNFSYEAYDLMNEMVVKASQFSEWTNIPYFELPHRAGALDNLVFTDMTGIEEVLNGDLPDIGERITLRLPAISISIACTPYGPEHFYTAVRDTSSSTYTSFSFLPRCATKACNETLGGGPSSNKFSWIIDGWNKKRNGHYLGEAYVGGNAKLTNLTGFDTPYGLFLGDFPGLELDVRNETLIPQDDYSKALAPGMFSKLPTESFPRVLGVSCTKALHQITVEATFNKLSTLTLNGTRQSAWSVFSYNKSSIRTVRQYNPATPLWAYPRHTAASQYNDDADSILDGDSLFPTPARPFNIFELIAVWQKYQSGGKLEELLEPAPLARAVENAWTSYLVEMITELRPHISAIATAEKNTAVIEGTMSIPIIRMQQSYQLTVALCVLLLLMLLGLIYVFVRFPREAFLMASPTSLAVTMGLLAGSRFLAELRKDGVRSVNDLESWRSKRFRLGWWPVLDENGRESWRWGIDVVEDGVVEVVR